MAAGADHVFTEIAELLSADASIWIRAIHEERWVAYPRAKIILEKLERLFDYPRRSRMPCLLLVGRPGMGKTMLLERFCRQHESCWEAERGREHTPVLSVVIRPQPTVRRLYAQLLSALGTPVVSTASTIVLEDRVHRMLLALGTKMLIADEIHNVFTAARSSDRDALMALLRTLIGELRISLVCAGTNEAENAILGDEQLASRYEPLQLPAWQPAAKRGVSGAGRECPAVDAPPAVLGVEHVGHKAPSRYYPGGDGQSIPRGCRPG